MEANANMAKLQQMMWQGISTFVTVALLCNPRHWFNGGAQIQAMDTKQIESQVLHYLATGNPIQCDDDFFDYNYHPILQNIEDFDTNNIYAPPCLYDSTDLDICVSYEAAAKAPWDDTSHKGPDYDNESDDPLEPNQSSKSAPTSPRKFTLPSASRVARSLGKRPKRPTSSQLYTLQAGAAMCNQNPEHHNFGQFTGNNALHDYLTTYCLEPVDSSSETLKGNLKPVEICLQVEGDLINDKHVSIPLKHEDIVYDPTLIVDLTDMDADQRDEYFKVINKEMDALCALGFAEVSIVATNSPVPNTPRIICPWNTSGI